MLGLVIYLFVAATTLELSCAVWLVWLTVVVVTFVRNQRDPFWLRISARRSAGADPSSRRLVIHGDFTNDNVVASGTPPRPAGIIDFALAHAESPLTDIGYALWRSGLPGPDADHLDLSRVRRFVGGYAAAAGLTDGDADAIPVYLWGRGLQMIAKRVLAGLPETGMLTEVRWLAEHDQALRDAVAAAR